MGERKRVAVVGAMNIDIQGKTFLPFRPGDSNPGSLRIEAGGVGRNIAENLARLGLDVELISVLGDDFNASLLEASCRDAGVGLGGCSRLVGRTSSSYLCILDTDGSLAGGLAAMDAMDELGPERLEAAAAILDSCEIIIVDANVPEASIKWLAARYPKGGRGPALGFDPVSARKAARGRASLPAFAFAKPNRAEAAVLAGLAGPGGHTGLHGERYDPTALAPDALARALRSRGLGEAFVSLGSDGIWAEGGGGERWIAKLPEGGIPGWAPASSSGAGDAACAAIAWGSLAGASLGERCALALAAAAVTAAADRPVSKNMCAGLVAELAKGIQRERIS